MTTARIGRVALVAAAVVAAQWLSGAVVAPFEDGAARVGAVGPLISMPWLLAGLALGGLELARPSGSLWPWLVLALPLAAPAIAGTWLFTGPGAAVVWASVAAVAGWTRLAPALVDRPGHQPWRSVPAAAILGLVWLGTASEMVAPHAMSGDAPHYLTMTRSLVEDGDLDLTNDYDDRTHRGFFAGSLEPRHTVTGPWGQQYSFHGIGVSVLVAPAFSVFGATGATWTLVAIMAAGAALLWTTVRDITGEPGAAWFAWGSLLASAPYTFHAAAVYPDGPASIGVIGALWLLARDRARPAPSLATLAAVGAGLAALPWLHARLALPAAVFGLACVLAVLADARDRWSRVAWLLTVPIISCAAWVASSYVMFGTWNPAATILGRTAPGALGTAPAGIFGLLFDQEFGLLPTSPVFALAPLGLAPLQRRRLRLAVAGVTALTGVIATSSLWVWWGGDSAPARFLTVALPVAAAALGSAWAASGERRRRVLLFALALSVTATALMATVDGGGHVYNFPDGRGSIFEALSPAVNVAAALPSMFRPEATLHSELPIVAIWIAAASLAGAAIAWWPTSAPGGPGVAAMVALVIGGGGASAAWAMRGVDSRTPAAAQLQLARRMAVSSAAGLGIWPHASLDALARRLALRTPESLTQPADMRLYVPDVPAGTYAITTAPAAVANGGECRLELGRDAWPYAVWDARDTPPTVRLATAVHSIRVAGCGPSIEDVWLAPVTAPRASDRVARRVSRIGGLDVYALDDSSYVDVDGFWTGGDRSVSFLIASKTPARVRLHLAAGPSPVVVGIRHASAAGTTVDLAADARSSIDLGDVSADSAIPLRVDVKGGFPGRLLRHGDSRSLGVRLTFEATPLPRGAF